MTLRPARAGHHHGRGQRQHQQGQAARSGQAGSRQGPCNEHRRRRHAAFALEQGRFTRKPHQPHYQSRDYNPLNGDVQRWFDPVEDATIALPVTQALLAFCASHFDPASSGDWHVEMHQFRIEAKTGEQGKPTPEGAPLSKLADKRVAIIGTGATAIQCVETANTVVNVVAGGTANASAPACAAGYTQTATNCETTSWLMPIVYFQSGTCSARNNDTVSQTLRASRTCCRVPGR